MPVLSRFLGIDIKMYFEDHNPPHFHAFYNEYEASLSIDPLEVIEGKLPHRVLGIVMEWASLHQKELMQTWDNIQNDKPIKKIKPLA